MQITRKGMLRMGSMAQKVIPLVMNPDAGSGAPRAVFMIKRTTE